MSMKHKLACVTCALLPLYTTACASDNTRPAVEVRIVEKLVEVQKPCPVQKPDRPAPLARPLPGDSTQLAALLALKLADWAGPGGYGDRAEMALNRCLSAASAP